MIRAVLGEADTDCLAMALSLLPDEKLIPILRMASNDYNIWDYSTFPRVTNDMLHRILHEKVSEVELTSKINNTMVVYDNFNQEVTISANLLVFENEDVTTHRVYTSVTYDEWQEYYKEKEWSEI